MVHLPHALQTALDSERADLASELATLQAAKAEADKKRKQAEQQLNELTSQFGQVRYPESPVLIDKSNSWNPNFKSKLLLSKDNSI